MFFCFCITHVEKLHTDRTRTLDDFAVMCSYLFYLLFLLKNIKYKHNTQLLFVIPIIARVLNYIQGSI